MSDFARIDGVAIVTGGASGIGAACARELARRGARLALIDRAPVVEGTARDMAAATGADVQGFVADVCDEVALAQVAAKIAALLGPVRVLVNSAGILQKPLPPQDLPQAEWDEVMRVDLKGTYLACRIFGAEMAKARGGDRAIVNIASITGLRSTPLHAYGPAKAAVIALTANLAAEWGPAALRVNAVAPGFTATPALTAAIARGERNPDNLTGNAALGRLVEMDEVARAVGFLASPEASAITGVTLPVDCGWLVTGPWATYGGLRGG